MLKQAKIRSNSLIQFMMFLGMCLLAMVVSAQNETWRVWLYNAGNGEMIQVDGDGFIQAQAELPLPTGYEFLPFEVAVSGDGSRAAYVVSDSINGTGLLIVFDLIRNEIILEFTLDSLFVDSISLSGDDTGMFNQTGTALALGYSLREGGWQVLIIDLNAGLVSLFLRDSLPNVQEMGIPNDLGMTPVVRSYDGTEVIFTMVQASELGNPQSVRGAFVWDTSRNSVRAVGGYASLDGDVFNPTGEAIMALVDTAFAEDNVASPPNTIYVYEDATETGYPIYAADGEAIFSPRFIQNGEKVLFGSYDANGLPHYFVMGRNGVIEGEWEAGRDLIVSGIYGTAEGFIYTVDTIDPDEGGSSTLFSVNTFAGLDAGVSLFTSVSRTFPRIVWLEDTRLRQVPLTPWVQILPGDQQDAIPNPTVAPSSVSISDWQAWIYQDSGIAMRIDQTGTVLDEERINPVVGQSLSIPANITTSNDGSLLVYVLSENGLPTILQVYDTRRDNILMEYPIPHDGSTSIPSHTIERAPEKTLFSERDQTLAFSYGLGAAGWQISVLETISGDEIATLRHDSPAMQPLGTESGFGVVPVIQQHTEDEVYFTVHPAGVLRPPYPSFVWNFRTNEVNPSQIYASISSDVFIPSGEVIMSLIDDRLPNTADRFSFGQLNALHIYDPVSAARYPFFVSEELWLFQPQFIQNGERILVGGSDPSGAFTGWVVIERHGGRVGVVPFNSDILDTAGTGDGFIYIPREEKATLSLFEVDTRDGIDAGEIIWQTERTGNPQIAWVDFDRTIVEVPGWARLDVPIAAGDPQLEVATPAPSAELVVGVRATVRITGGDALIVRIGAGTGFTIAGRVNTGSTVTLIEGPRVVRGVNWWRIQTEGGLDGWVAERINNTLTLTPLE